MFNETKNKVAALMACALLSMMFVLQGCPIVAVAIYAAYTDDGGITVTTEIPRSAPDIFEAAKKRVAKGETIHGFPFKVTKIDEENYTLALEGEDGTWRGEFFIIPITAHKSQVIAQGSDDHRAKDESEHLILIGVENLCKDLGVNYTVVGRRMSGGSLD